MRRKKDDKQVLIPRNRPKNNKRRRRSNKRHRKLNNRQMPNNRQRMPNNRQRKKRKTSGITLTLMIIALVAFIIGAGIGISLSFEEKAPDEGPHYENVTDEMTTNLNDTTPVSFDKGVDDVDFNDNQTASDFNVSNEPSY